VSLSPKKPLDQLRDQIQVKHYSSLTEETNTYWVREFILFHRKNQALSVTK